MKELCMINQYQEKKLRQGGRILLKAKCQPWDRMASQKWAQLWCNDGGKNPKQWESMSEERDARIRNYQNGRQSGRVPEQSTTAEQREVEHIRCLLKSSEGSPSYTSRTWVGARKSTAPPKLHPIDQRSYKDWFGLHILTAQAEILILAGETFHGPPSKLPASKKTWETHETQNHPRKGKRRKAKGAG